MAQTTPAAPQPRRRFPFTLATVLFLFAAVAAALLGYRTGRVLYRSDGVININPVVSDLGYQPVVVPMYRQYVLEQMARIHSQRVIEMAMTSPQWRQFSRGMSPDAKADFHKALDVTMPYNDAGLIFVAFTDENPAAAQVAVKEMIHAFQVVSEEAGGQPLSYKVANLTDEASRLRQQIAVKEQDIRQTLRGVQERGSDDLAAIYGRYREQLADVELQKAYAEGALKAVQSPAEPQGQNPATSPARSEADPARLDPRTALLMIDHESDAAHLERLRGELREAERRYEILQARANKYGAAQEKIVQARADIEELKHKLGENQASLKHFQASLAQNGNIQILDPGSTPYVPISDTRRSRAAAGAGAVLAAGAMAAIVATAASGVRRR